MAGEESGGRSPGAAEKTGGKEAASGGESSARSPRCHPGAPSHQKTLLAALFMLELLDIRGVERTNVLRYAARRKAVFGNLEDITFFSAFLKHE